MKQCVLLLRGLMFVGRRYRCPCCCWRLRAFTGRWTLLAATPDGYCPRCNAKARHRRLWRYLQANTRLFSERQTLLEVAPWWSLSRRFLGMRHLDFLGLDPIRTGPHVNVVGTLESTPLASNSVDTLLCIHVLEHIADDRSAMRELYRVLKPGGDAIVSVPLQLDRATIEDPTITDPAERERLFGERGHVRYYGLDVIERLEKAGFQVRLSLASEIPPAERARFGLRDDESVLHCRKPSPERRCSGTHPAYAH